MGAALRSLGHGEAWTISEVNAEAVDPRIVVHKMVWTVLFTLNYPSGSRLILL